MGGRESSSRGRRSSCGRKEGRRVGGRDVVVVKRKEVVLEKGRRRRYIRWEGDACASLL